MRKADMLSTDVASGATFLAFVHFVPASTLHNSLPQLPKLQAVRTLAALFAFLFATGVSFQDAVNEPAVVEP
jgi:hypothetical protein